MKPARTYLQRSVVGVGLAYFVLKSTTFEILVEAFVPLYLAVVHPILRYANPAFFTVAANVCPTEAAFTKLSNTSYCFRKLSVLECIECFGFDLLAVNLLRLHVNTVPLVFLVLLPLSQGQPASQSPARLAFDAKGYGAPLLAGVGCC